MVEWDGSGDTVNTTQASKLDSLLNYGVPKKNQSVRSVHKFVIYMDDPHIMMIRESEPDPPEGILEHHFIGANEVESVNDKVIDEAKAYPAVFVDRKRLLAILNAMDSDIVRIALNEDSPICVSGYCAKWERYIEGVIAPRWYDPSVKADYYEK